MDPAAYQLRKQHEGQSGFWVFPRQPTEAESKADPGLLVPGDNSRSFVLPTHNLRPMTAIEYSTLVFIMCNPSLSGTYVTNLELWSTLVQILYHFEKDNEWQERKGFLLLASREEEEEIVFGNERGGVVKIDLPDKAISRSRRDIAIQMADVAAEGQHRLPLQFHFTSLQPRYPGPHPRNPPPNLE